METNHSNFKISFMSRITLTNSDMCFHLSNRPRLIDCSEILVKTLCFTKFSRSIMILGFS